MSILALFDLLENVELFPHLFHSQFPIPNSKFTILNSSASTPETPPPIPHKTIRQTITSVDLLTLGELANG